MKKKLHRLLVFFLLCQLNAAAQTEGYNYEAAIKPVDSSGFYNIVLTPELNAHLKTDYSDLRILNDTGKWVPHLVGFPAKGSCNLPFEWDLKIIKNETINNITHVVIEGHDKNVRDLVLIIKNSLAERYCTLTGSDDMDSWFIINDSIKIVTEEDRIERNAIKFTLRFPLVSYKFFKVSINNNGKDGFKILKARSTAIKDLSSEHFYIPLVENPAVNLSQKDSNNFSFVRIEQANAYHFNKVDINVSGVKYFNRKARLYIPTSVNHSFSAPGAFVADLSISNNSTLEFNISPSKAKTFYIIIQNDDNLPLKVDKVKTFSDHGVATVYLEKGKQYKLILDNPAASAPNYDLSINDISSREKLPAATFSSIIALPRQGLVRTQQSNSKNLIWIVIALAAAVLAFFTYRLITDMNKSKT